MVEVRGVPAVFTGCEFMNSNRSGLHVWNALSPSVTGCTFGESYSGLSMDGTSMATNVSGNTFGPQSDNSYVVSVTADCMEGTAVGQNVFQLRSDGKYGRLAVEESALTMSAMWPVPPSGFVYYMGDGQQLSIGDRAVQDCRCSLARWSREVLTGYM